jgi:hypothetical protein
MRPSRQLSGVLFLGLAMVLAVAGNVDPAKGLVRWIAVAAMAGWGIWSLTHERTRIEHVYAQLLAAGLAGAAVGWLIPGSGSRGLVLLGGAFALLSAGLLAWSWLQRRNASNDDANHPR